MNKTCFKCKRTLPLNEFYKHKQMADGYLNKCKDCSRLDTQQNRKRNIDYYREYDRKRSCLSHRVSKRKELFKNQKEDEPLKYTARTMAYNALRDGRLKMEACYFCHSTKNIEMHHPDYSRPLRVYWLCRICHRKIDGMNKIGIQK